MIKAFECICIRIAADPSFAHVPHELTKDEEYAKDGQIQTGDGEKNGSAYVSLPERMTNQQLAHDLLLDPLFQLDKSGGCSTKNPAFHGIRESFHRAFWDSIEDDVKLEPPCYVRVMRVL